MFAVGDYVIKATNGICRVEEIGHPDMGGANPEKLYYFLTPEKGKGSRLYVPVDMAEGRLRHVLTKEEAWALIDRMPEIGDTLDSDRKVRDQEMKSIVNGINPEELVRVIKFLYTDRQKRESDGKKMPVSEERYFRVAEDQLYGELAFAIGRSAEELPEIIKDAITQKTAV